MEDGQAPEQPKRRRIIVEADDDDSVGSNPDARIANDGDESEGEGEDLMDTLRQDYEADATLDRYDEDALGDDDVDENLDAAMRRQIDDELDRRDMMNRMMRGTQTLSRTPILLHSYSVLNANAT